MTDLFHEVWSYLERAWSGELPIGELESWIYEMHDSPSLKDALGPDFALELLAFDYRQPHREHEINKLIESIYDKRRPGGLDRDKARRLVETYLEGGMPLREAAARLAGLRDDSNQDWIPDDFTYIDSELENVPRPSLYRLWIPESLARKLKEAEPLIQGLEGRAREAARELLRYLKTWRPGPAVW